MGLVVGLSLSHCVADIADGRVDFKSVLVIITSTNFNVNIDEEWYDLWSYYGETTWSGMLEEEARKLVTDLWDAGKIHQPRQFTDDHWISGRHGAHHWQNIVWDDDWMRRHPAVQDTWNAYQTAVALTR